MSQNAYFQCNIKEDGVYMTLFPQEEGGDSLTFLEINLYLAKLKVGQFNRDVLKEALESLTEPVEVKLNDASVPPIDEFLSLKVSVDRMEAYGRFYCPSPDGKHMDKNDILTKLSDSNIKFGAIDETIDIWLQNRFYCTDILLAKGELPGESTDPIIEYKFQLTKEFKATVTEDGSVDYHKLNLISHVNTGDVLAILTPGIEGKHGANVYGQPLPSKRPAVKMLKAGKNAVLSDDGLQITSAIAGHVELDAGKVVVSNVYIIQGNVGVTTGDISYDGTVTINGDVLTGYSIDVSGDIFVNGIVEGASLQAGGRIVLSKGIYGKGTGKLKSGGNIAAKFIQDCVAECGGDVMADIIMYSKVSAQGSILVTGKKGLVAGGELKSGVLISVNTAGSNISSANPLLEVGPDPNIMREFYDLEKLLIKLKSDENKLVQTLTFLKRKLEREEQLTKEKIMMLEHISKQILDIRKEFPVQLERYRELKLQTEQYDSGRIKVRDVIHEGSKVVISGVSYSVHGQLQHCQFIKEGADIVTSPY